MNYINKIISKLIKRNLKRNGFKIYLDDVNPEVSPYVIEVNEQILFVATPTKWGITLDYPLHFSSDILGLKLLSDINQACSRFGSACSKASPASYSRCQIKITKHIGLEATFSLEAMMDFAACLGVVDKLLTEKETFCKEPKLDLSMFGNTKLDFFSPRTLGELKDFVYGTWTEFANEMVSLRESGQMSDDNYYLTISEIAACQEFEKRNDLMLSDVGDIVLRELNWSQDMDSNRDDPVLVN